MSVTTLLVHLLVVHQIVIGEPDWGVLYSRFNHYMLKIQVGCEQNILASTLA